MTQRRGGRRRRRRRREQPRRQQRDSSSSYQAPLPCSWCANESKCKLRERQQQRRRASLECKQNACNSRKEEQLGAEEQNATSAPSAQKWANSNAAAAAATALALGPRCIGQQLQKQSRQQHRSRAQPPNCKLRRRCDQSDDIVLKQQQLAKKASLRRDNDKISRRRGQLVVVDASKSGSNVFIDSLATSNQKTLTWSTQLENDILTTNKKVPLTRSTANGIISCLITNKLNIKVNNSTTRTKLISTSKRAPSYQRGKAAKQTSELNVVKSSLITTRNKIVKTTIGRKQTLSCQAADSLFDSKVLLMPTRVRASLAPNHRSLKKPRIIMNAVQSSEVRQLQSHGYNLRRLSSVTSNTMRRQSPVAQSNAPAIASMSSTATTTTATNNSANATSQIMNDMDFIKARSLPHPWHWSETDKSHECLILDKDKRRICFHPVCSDSAAACRGSQAFERNGNYYYWEIYVEDKVYGTSVMFGLCNKQQQMHARDYCNLVGLDENGWSLSHKGYIWHDGISRHYTSMFPLNQSIIIGLLYDTMRGELSYFMDGKNMGVAFTGLNEKFDSDLYPVVGSTSKCTRMRLLGTYYGVRLSSLVQLSCFNLLKNASNKFALIEYLQRNRVPKNLLDYLKQQANIINDDDTDDKDNQEYKDNNNNYRIIQQEEDRSLPYYQFD